jgi:hypothetical protein
MCVDERVDGEVELKGKKKCELIESNKRIVILR